MDCITREQVAFGQAYVQHVGAGFMEDGFEIRLKRPGIRFEVLATAWSQHHALSLCRAFNSSPNLLHKFPTRDAARAIIGNCVRGGAWKGGAFDLKSLADAIHQKTGLTFTDFQPIQDWVEHWNFILPTAGGYCLLPDMVFCTLDGQLHDVTIADPHRHFMTTSHTRAETEAEYAQWKKKKATAPQPPVERRPSTSTLDPMTYPTREDVDIGQAYIEYRPNKPEDLKYEIRIKGPGDAFQVVCLRTPETAGTICRLINEGGPSSLIQRFSDHEQARAIIARSGTALTAWKGGTFDIHGLEAVILKEINDANRFRTGNTVERQSVRQWLDHWNFVHHLHGDRYLLLPDCVYRTEDGVLHYSSHDLAPGDFIASGHTRAETEAEYARWKATGSREGKVPDDVSEGALSPSLEKLMRLFDFGRVRKHMVQHQWTWAFEEGPRVPRVAELQKVARRHLRSIEEGRSVQSMSGGFLAERWGYRTTLAFKNGGHTIVEASTLA